VRRHRAGPPEGHGGPGGRGGRDGPPADGPACILAAHWQRKVDEAAAGPPTSFRLNGFVVRAFQAALGAIVHTPVPSSLPCRHPRRRASDRRAHRQRHRHGGDDRRSLARGRVGATAVPARWVLMLHGWPGYRTKDLVHLAVLAAKKGATDKTGWPSIAEMLGHYAARWPAEPFVQPLAEDQGVCWPTSTAQSTPKPT